jgi:flavin-dependent dehydrogenase
VPASDGGLSVFEMTDRDLWQQELSGERFAATTLTRLRCGGQAIGASLGVFPAATVQHRVDAPGLLAVGDAAIARDPLAAEGLCFALVSAREAADTAAAMLAGDSRRQRAYTEGLNRVFGEHLEQRSHVYASEARWADRPFWQRRSTGTDSVVRSIPRESATRGSPQLTVAS